VTRKASSQSRGRARLDGAAAHFVRKGCAVFRDDDSRNAEAALKNLGHL